MNLQKIFRLGSVRYTADLVLPARPERLTVVSALPKMLVWPQSFLSMPNRMAGVTAQFRIRYAALLTRYCLGRCEKFLHHCLMNFSSHFSPSGNLPLSRFSAPFSSGRSYPSHNHSYLSPI